LIGISFFGSGSDGNSALIEGGKTRVLLDAGLSCKSIEENLSKRNLTLESLSGIFITHEHSDHIKGLKRLVRRFPGKIYATEGTIKAIRKKGIESAAFEIVKSRKEFQLDALRVWPFSVPHDAAEPIGFRVESNGFSISIATDLGHISPLARDFLTDCDFLCIESNYDEKMLAMCSYPSWLKSRIRSPFGHLSNLGVREVINRLKRPITHLLLVHISKESNSHLIAGRNLIPLMDNPQLQGAKITLATQDQPTPLLQIHPRLVNKACMLAKKPIQRLFNFYD